MEYPEIRIFPFQKTKKVPQKRHFFVSLLRLNNEKEQFPSSSYEAPSMLSFGTLPKNPSKHREVGTRSEANDGTLLVDLTND